MFLIPCALAQEKSALLVSFTIPDGTAIDLQLAESVSSAHARTGDRLGFVVVRDVSVGGFIVIPAGTTARGSVTRVKGKRFLGIGGNVALKLDSLDLVNGDRVRLRGCMEVKGQSRTPLMAAAMIATGLVFLPATPVFLLTRGHDSTVVKSKEITAQIDGPASVLSAGLQRSPENHSEVDVMMDYLPPRVFNGEGREGDMVNLVFVGQQEDLQKAFERAGWVTTDKWKPVFVWHLLWHGTRDARLPMARFYLFGRVQDYSYALPAPGAIALRRHHLRIWKTEYTIDGTPIWAGAATHDVGVEIARQWRLINHRIDPAVDKERDFVGTGLENTLSVSRQEYLHSVDPVFQAQTTSGETYHSDGKILLLDLHPAVSANSAVTGQSSAFVQATVLPIAAPAEPLPRKQTPPL